MSTASRRTKHHPAPPPPPSPKILHFPRIRRTRRKQPSTTQNHRGDPFLLLHRRYLSSSRGNLKNMFDVQENNGLQPPVVFLNCKSRTLSVARRDRVEEEEEEEEEEDWIEYDGRGATGLEEEKWMFQAEILRAECNVLRMEREFALKKLERNRVKMERTLRSAVQTLVSGRRKICEGKNASSVLQKEIEHLSEKLEELHRSTRAQVTEVGNCSNFDKKACLLQRRLWKLGKFPDKSCLNGLQELVDIDKQDHVSNRKTENKSNEVDELRKEMKGLDEHGCMLSSAASSLVGSDSKGGVLCPNLSSFSTRQELVLHGDNGCSGHCKAIIRGIMEQVRAETEQWSQMQEMLECVRGEMEELQASHDFWETRARSSDHEIQSLKLAVEEWKGKALDYEVKARELELQQSEPPKELRKPKAEQNGQAELTLDPPRKQHEKKKPPLSSHDVKENKHVDEKIFKFQNANKEKNLATISLGKKLAEERRVLPCRLKERRQGSEKELSSDGRRKAYSGGVAMERSPLQDIGNSASSAWQEVEKDSESDQIVLVSGREREPKESIFSY